ncbi:DNA polymerase III subunit gamma/tau [Candidatus Saccharibacteria bacterium]|nr:DNA polymerase III subunit gamma/tau [Candidatus Saccharibacteria bacterium]
MSKALYRKYRSKSLDGVIGQKHITDILSRAIAEGHISHAYLLTGPRGVGKTSVARILAHEINGLDYDTESNHLDIIEIDAASNNGVEDVRDLREKVQIAPFSASKKVYIIDEVHMLSKAAFNALLKTLEEPPEHVVFILATTNIEKLPATIVSRVQRFSFRPITIDDAVKHLASIAKSEKINITDDALRLIAGRSDGSFRDSISLLDQLSNLVSGDKEQITVELIEDMLGLAPSDMIDQLLAAVENHDVNKVVSLLNQSFDEGVDGGVLVSQLIAKIRSEIATKPQLLILLDSLIDVAKSPDPQLKLLSILGQASYQKPATKSVALAATPLEVVSSIAELEEQAVQERPSELKMKKKTDECKKSEKADRVASGELDWNKLLAHVKQNHIALYCVLAKCGHELDDNTLTLYANNKFYKKKLDDTKYTALLSQCLQEVGVYGLNVHTIPTTIPPSDSKLAAVTAIMGGGVEVSLEPV